MTLPPVVKTVVVKCDPRQAFRYFTEDFSKWWPGASHSVTAFSSERKIVPEACVLETKNGGRIYERTSAGEKHEWGTIFLWDPPKRIAFSWHPGRSEDLAQTVEVTFTVSPEGTVVTLTHTGWEKLGESAAEAWKSYDGGWETVLGKCFVDYANEFGRME